MSPVHALQCVPADGVAPTPWRNGGGQTRELLTRPEHGKWLLRISLADIDRDGPFSAFPATQRWFAVVAGAGVALRFGDDVRELTADSAPLQFDGAAAPGCSLLNGPTRDLNLMLRSGAGLMCAVQANRVWEAAFNERGLFTLCEGILHRHDHEAVHLRPRTLVWFLGPGRCRFEPGAPGRAGWWLAWSGDAVQQE